MMDGHQVEVAQRLEWWACLKVENRLRASRGGEVGERAQKIKNIEDVLIVVKREKQKGGEACE